MRNFIWYSFEDGISSLKELKEYAFTKLLHKPILGYTYVIVLSNNRIKIGSTSNVYNRISSLHSEYVNRRNLRMIGAYVSAAHNKYFETEKILHEMLKPYRISRTEEFQLPKNTSIEIIHAWLELLFENLGNLQTSPLEIYDLALDELQRWIASVNLFNMCKDKKFTAACTDRYFPEIEGCKIVSFVIHGDYPEPLALYSDGLT